MCGIVGIVFSPSREKLNDIQKMTSSLFLRGPDDQGTWIDQEDGIALGFRRLSIIDLSQAGHQPMESNSKRFMIVFNGEIYNFKEIADELLQLGWRFRGHSDTEVLLAAIDTWGIEESLKKFDGMFAFALWDKQNKALYLARDRFGEKPLYWGWVENTLLFGSELKAFNHYRHFNPEIDRSSLNLFMRYGYIPSPYSIFKEINKIEPGHYLCIYKNKKVEKNIYWSANETAQKIIDSKEKVNEQEALKLLEESLKKSISLRSIADVPIGSFLSGGIDSSLITAIMQANSSKPIHTFTIGFNEKEFNEASYAKAIASHLSTCHTELYVTDKHALEIIPKLPSLYDEPFGDSSQLPTYLLSQLARQSVKVCLSGDGGDELFGGYNRYTWGPTLYNYLSYIPPFVRKPLAKLLISLHFERQGAVGEKLVKYLLFYEKVVNLPHKIIKTCETLASLGSFEQFYTSLSSTIKNPELLVLEDDYGHPLRHVNTLRSGEGDKCAWMMLEDVLTYLPGDILTKVDRASMGNSLETRMPFLNPHLFEIAWSLPSSMKIHNKVGKIALRQLLYQYIPKQLIERPKSGFEVPIGRWLLGPLKDWASDLLSEKRIEEEGFLNSHIVKKYWQEHLSEKRNRAHELWNILMFQAWLQETRKTLPQN